MKEKSASFKPWYSHREGGRSSKEIFESARDKSFMDAMVELIDTAVTDWIQHVDGQKLLTEEQIDQLLAKLSAKISFDAHQSLYEALLFYFLATIEKFLNRSLSVEEESALSNKFRAKFFEQL